MADKKYVVITHAVRERLLERYSPPEVEAQPYDYRRGELGLVHPFIIEFFQDYEENMKKINASTSLTDQVLQGRGATRIISTSGIIELFKPDPTTIPVLFSKERSPKERYLLAHFEEGELVGLLSLQLEAVKKEVRDIYQTKSITKYAPELLNSYVEETWRKLESFEFFDKNQLDTIPIEVAQKKISKETIDSRLDILKTFEEYEQNARLSWIYSQGIVLD